MLAIMSTPPSNANCVSLCCTGVGAATLLSLAYSANPPTISTLPLAPASNASSHCKAARTVSMALLVSLAIMATIWILLLFAPPVHRWSAAYLASMAHTANTARIHTSCRLVKTFAIHVLLWKGAMRVLPM